MPSKLSIHIRDYPDGIFDAVGRMQPSIIKVFEHDSEMNIDALRRAAKPLVIYRHFTQNNDFQTHPAADFVAELEQRGTLGKLKGRGILWEGINEPGIGEEGSAADHARARALNRITTRTADPAWGSPAPLRVSQTPSLIRLNGWRQ